MGWVGAGPGRAASERLARGSGRRGEHAPPLPSTEPAHAARRDWPRRLVAPPPPPRPFPPAGTPRRGQSAPPPPPTSRRGRPIAAALGGAWLFRGKKDLARKSGRDFAERKAAAAGGGAGAGAGSGARSRRRRRHGPAAPPPPPPRPSRSPDSPSASAPPAPRPPRVRALSARAPAMAVAPAAGAGAGAPALEALLEAGALGLLEASQIVIISAAQDAAAAPAPPAAPRDPDPDLLLFATPPAARPQRPAALGRPPVRTGSGAGGRGFPGPERPRPVGAGSAARRGAARPGRPCGAGRCQVPGPPRRGAG